VSEKPPKIGKYNVLSEIGQGASALVYVGEDPFNDRKVAIKVAKSDADMSEEEANRFGKLFLNEASLAGKLNHPNIVAVYDAVVDGDQRYIVMEFVPGGSLKKFCTETNLLPVRQAVLVIFKMCRALDYAFQNGVIHRDIKPANILLSERDDIKISDFGTAKISHATHTQIEGFLGSPAYMSPEQINEESPSVQSDIYSLGVVMYELLTGKLPFRAENSVSMINKILNEEPLPLEQMRPDLPEKLVDIVKKAMAKDPRQRYQTWFEMASELADTFPQLERYSSEISSTEKFNRLRSLPFFRDFRDAELWEVLRGAIWEVHQRDANLLLEGELGGGWSSQVALTLLNARFYSSFRTCAPLAAFCNPVTGANTAVVADGNRVPGVPNASLFADLAYRNAALGLTAAFEVIANGSIAVNDFNSAFAPGYAIANVWAGLTQQSGRWRFREFVRINNLFDRETIGAVIVGDANGRYYAPAPTRNFLAGVAATLTF